MIYPVYRLNEDPDPDFVNPEPEVGSGFPNPDRDRDFYTLDKMGLAGLKSANKLQIRISKKKNSMLNLILRRLFWPVPKNWKNPSPMYTNQPDQSE